MAATLLGVSSLALVIDTSSAYKVDRETLTISTVQAAPFEDYINIRGRVEPATVHYLDAVEGGIVEEILLEEGSMVQTGDTILKLSNLNLSLNILNSEAQLAEKANFLRETQLEMEQQKLSLQRELARLDHELVQMERSYGQKKIYFQKGLISRNEFLESEEGYNLALNLKKLSVERHRQDSVYRKVQIQKITQNLQSMERNLELIYQRQDHLVVRSPIDGQLASLNAVPGQAIKPGQRLGQVNILTEYKLQASIDEHYIDRVGPGLKATLERQGTRYHLKVSKVYPEVSQGNFQVDLTFDSTVPDNIRSGQNYNLNLALGETSEAVLLARGGFFQATGGHWVYVLNADGSEAIRKDVHLGRQNPKCYEVLEGLKPGERVVTSSYEHFGENEKLILK